MIKVKTNLLYWTLCITLLNTQCVYGASKDNGDKTTQSEYDFILQKINQDQTLKNIFENFVFNGQPLKLRPTFAALNYATLYIKFLVCQCRNGIITLDVMMETIQTLHDEIYALPNFISTIQPQQYGNDTVQNFQKAYQKARSIMDNASQDISSTSSNHLSSSSYPQIDQKLNTIEYASLLSEIHRDKALKDTFENFIYRKQPLNLRLTLPALIYATLYIDFLTYQFTNEIRNASIIMPTIQALYDEIRKLLTVSTDIQLQQDGRTAIRNFEDSYELAQCLIASVKQ